MADMTPDERAMDSVGWFIKTPPDSEEQDLLRDIAAAIREAVEVREREIVEMLRAMGFDCSDEMAAVTLDAAANLIEARKE